MSENRKHKLGCHKCAWASSSGKCYRTGIYIGGFFGLDVVPGFCPIDESDKKKVDKKK